MTRPCPEPELTDIDDRKPRAGRRPDAVTIATRVLREAIADGRLVGNQRLIELDLVDAFGLPRGAVRQALMRLATEGFVERTRFQGARVRSVPPAELREMLEVLLELEVLCAGYAARRSLDECEGADLAQHVELMWTSVMAGDVVGVADSAEAARAGIRHRGRQKAAAREAERLVEHTRRFRRDDLLRPDRLRQAADEHDRMVRAVLDGDPDAAERCVRGYYAEVMSVLDASS